MQILKEFSDWMSENSRLSESSIYKYTRAINTISNDMLERNVLNRSLLEMNLVEIDIAIMNIFNNSYFIQKNSVGNKMYSNALKQFRYFSLDRVDEKEGEMTIVQQISDSKKLAQTEKQSIIRARIGQGLYRTNLLKKYDNKCIISGINNSKLLIASHIKPWAICQNNERIDIENGLLLNPNMDRLFDSGLVSFNDDGKMLISTFIGEENLHRLHLSKDIIVDLRSTKQLLSYLEYHRDVLFVK